MTHQEIKELAGHRAVSPWVMKLVGDAVAKEREECAKECEAQLNEGECPERAQYCADAIRAREQP